MGAAKQTNTVNGYGEKISVRIITVDKAKNRVECATRDGAMIFAAVWETGTVFRWPEVGETWTVRKDTGIWRLDAIVTTNLGELESEHFPTTLAELPEGSTRIVGESVYVNEVLEGTNVRFHGAQGDNSTDDTDAIQRAINSLGANGGVVFFPYGTYRISGQLNLDNRRSVRLLGVGGLTAGSPAATKLLFTQGGSAGAISARSSVGLGIADMAIGHTSSSLTGALLDLSHSTTGGDAAYGNFERVQFVGEGGIRSALGVDLDRAIVMAFRGCYFHGLAGGGRGKTENSRYSNSIRFDDCIFTRNESFSLKNAGQGWFITGCTFDTPLQNLGASAYSQDAGFTSEAVTISGCWMGDLASTVGETTWINWNGHGLTVKGNLIGGTVSGGSVTAVRASATSTAIDVTGNRGVALTNGVIFAAGVQHYMIGANQWGGPSGKAVSLDGGSTSAGEGFLTN